MIPRDDGAAPRRVSVHNRQRTRAIDRRGLQQLAGAFCDLLPELAGAQLDVNLLAAPAMTRLNETFLQHAGATDVITFDYRDPAGPGTPMHGEIFICVDEAVRQAARFRTGWETEIVRYLVHGVLHLVGHDDRRPAARRRMKQAENRWVRTLARRFPFRKLANRRLSA